MSQPYEPSPEVRRRAAFLLWLANLAFGALLMSLFVGWVWGGRKAAAELAQGSDFFASTSGIWIFMIRFFIPAVIFVILLTCKPGFASEMYYIDPSSPTDGDGTINNPWNTFIHVNPGGSHTFSGTELVRKDNDNSMILIKSDTEIRETL